jgi:hypothetical protein
LQTLITALKDYPEILDQQGIKSLRKLLRV